MASFKNEVFESFQASVQKQDELGLDENHYADDDDYDEEGDGSLSRSPERHTADDDVRLVAPMSIKTLHCTKDEHSHARQCLVHHRHSFSSECDPWRMIDDPSLERLTILGQKFYTCSLITYDTVIL